MRERPLKEGYYAILGTVTAVFAVMRALREDWAIAAVLAVVAAVMFAAAAYERRSAR
jgi:hypothetical protein